MSDYNVKITHMTVYNVQIGQPFDNLSYVIVEHLLRDGHAIS